MHKMIYILHIIIYMYYTRIYNYIRITNFRYLLLYLMTYKKNLHIYYIISCLYKCVYSYIKGGSILIMIRSMKKDVLYNRMMSSSYNECSKTTPQHILCVPKMSIER